MRNRFPKQILTGGALVAALLVLMAATAAAQRVTGQWDFDDPDDGFRATVGADGYVWARPTSDQSAEVAFDTASGFGIPLMPNGDGGVMSFPAFDPFNGVAMWHGMPANGGGWYVNEYTIIFDVLFPPQSAGQWRCFWQTNYCNTNDGDFFVNPADGIGISGVYDGQILPNTWHRVAFAVGLTGDPNNPDAFVDKYIDGVQVGSQTLDTLDGRWSLYTADDAVPTLVFADNDGDTAPGYVSSIQIRDYTMTQPELAALGGVSAAGIPVGTGVAGLWNFENPASGYQAAVGNDLEFWNAFAFDCVDPNCPQDLNATSEFGTSGDFGIPDLPDGPANVMWFDATIPCTGYMFPHGADANGGGTRVNNYTIIMDVYFTLADYFSPPEGHDPSWIALYQTWAMNDGDAMLWIRTADGALGDDSLYDGTEGWCYEEEWLRIVAAVDASDPNAVALTKYVLYADDAYSGPVTEDMGESLDGKRALRTAAEAGEDVLFLFTDENYETHRGFVSSVQIRDYVMTEAEVAALGGPRAAGIPRPPACDGDVDGDGDTDLTDLAALLAAYGSSVGDPGYNANADFDDNGQVNLNDLAFLLADYGCQP